MMPDFLDACRCDQCCRPTGVARLQSVCPSDTPVTLRVCPDCCRDILWNAADDIIPLADPWEQTPAWLQTVFLSRWFRFRVVHWLWTHAYRRHVRQTLSCTD